MGDRVALLVGTRKGAFILEATPAGRTGRSAARCATAGRSTTSSTIRRPARSLAGGGSPWYGAAVWRSDDLGATWTHSSEGLTYGDDGPKITTVWNVTPAHGGALRGRRAGGPVPQHRRRRDVGARRGPDEPPDPPRVAARATAG